MIFVTALAIGMVAGIARSAMVIAFVAVVGGLGFGLAAVFTSASVSLVGLYSGFNCGLATALAAQMLKARHRG